MSGPNFASDRRRRARTAAQAEIAAAAALLTALGCACLTAVPARAENAFLQQGIKDYNAGNYSEAAGHLGAALSTEFNNAVLHYYLANAYIKLKQREGAIREFRIAYALQPDGDLGKMCKTALTSMGAQAPDSSEKDSMLKEIEKLVNQQKPGGAPSGEQNYDNGRYLFARGDYTGAAAAFQRAAQSDPRNYAARYYEALAVEKSGSLAQAMQLYQKVKTSCGTSREGHMATLKLLPNSDPATLKTLEQAFLMQTAIAAQPTVGLVDVPFTRDGKYLVFEGSVGTRATKVYYDPYSPRVMLPTSWAGQQLQGIGVIDQNAIITLPELNGSFGRRVIAHRIKLGQVERHDVEAVIPLRIASISEPPPPGPVVGKAFFGTEPQIDYAHYIMRCKP